MKKSNKLIVGNWYKFADTNGGGGVHVGQYTGNDQGFECCVCGKGCKAHTFNIWYNENGWETWGFGNNHLPKIIENLGERENVIIDK